MDDTRPLTPDNVDLFDPGTQENWYPVYDLLREHAPVWRMPGTRTYVLTRYDDVQHVLRRTDLFGRGGAPDAPARSIPSIRIPPRLFLRQRIFSTGWSGWPAKREGSFVPSGAP